jgi:HB1, ASXL, restriction endonuclease HTH domain
MWIDRIEGSGVMAKKSGKTSTPAEKRGKASKRQAVVAEAAADDGAKAGVVENGQVEGTAAETAGAHTTPVDGAGPEAPAAEAAAETPEARPPGQACEHAPESVPAPAEAGGDPAAAEATARPKGRGKTRAPKTGPAGAVAKPGKLSALDAAAKVLAEAGAAMTCGEMIAAMAAKGYWTSPGGKTPAATLYSAILRETRIGGTQSRFTKTERGKFGLVARG